MSNEALSEAQVREVQQIAELETRRYFDHYLRDIWPVQAQALRDQTLQAVRLHNETKDAHGGVEMKLNRFIWLMLGASSVGGVASGSIISLLKQVL